MRSLLLLLLLPLAKAAAFAAFALEFPDEEYELTADASSAPTPSPTGAPTSAPASAILVQEAEKCDHACTNVRPSFDEVTCANLVARSCVCSWTYRGPCADHWTRDGPIAVCVGGHHWTRVVVEKRHGELHAQSDGVGSDEREVCEHTINEKSAGE